MLLAVRVAEGSSTVPVATVKSPAIELAPVMVKDPVPILVKLFPPVNAEPNPAALVPVSMVVLTPVRAVRARLAAVVYDPPNWKVLLPAKVSAVPLPKAASVGALRVPAKIFTGPLNVEAFPGGLSVRVLAPSLTRPNDALP